MIDFTLTDDRGQQTHASLPTCWADVTWAQYQDYVTLNDIEFESSYDKAVQQLAILARVDADLLEQTGWQVVVELFQHLEFLQRQPQVVPVAHVKVGSEVYYPQRLEIFGELIAYDKVMNAEGIGYEQKLPYVLAICLRKKTLKAVQQRVSRGWKRLLRLEETVVVETQEVEHFQNSTEWIDSRATLFAHALNVEQVRALAAFFLTSAASYQSASLTFSKLHPRILSQARSLEQVSAAITVGNWQSGIFARILLKSINCYFYLLTKYFNVSNTSELSETKSAASNSGNNTVTTPQSSADSQ